MNSLTTAGITASVCIVLFIVLHFTYYAPKLRDHIQIRGVPVSSSDAPEQTSIVHVYSRKPNGSFVVAHTGKIFNIHKDGKGSIFIGNYQAKRSDGSFYEVQEVNDMTLQNFFGSILIKIPNGYQIYYYATMKEVRSSSLDDVIASQEAIKLDRIYSNGQFLTYIHREGASTTSAILETGALWMDKVTVEKSGSDLTATCSDSITAAHIDYHVAIYLVNGIL